MKLYNVNEHQYGWIFSAIAIGLIASSQINNLVMKKYSSAQIIRAVLLCQSVVGILLAVGTLAGWLGLFSIIFLIFLFLSCQGFTFPNSAALAMAPFEKGAGSASALMGALQMCAGAIASALVGVFFNGTALPMTAIMAFCSMMGLTILIIGTRQIKHRARNTRLKENQLKLI